MAKSKQARGIALTKENLAHFSAAGVCYATEKMATETKERLRRLRAAAAKGS